MNLLELSRTVAFRLTLFYSLFFTACVVALLGFVYWQTAIELTRRVDQVLLLERNDFSRLREERIADELDKRIQRDQRHVFFYGLFGRDGAWLGGNVRALPQNLPQDGNIYQVSQFSGPLQPQPMPIRALIIPLDSRGSLLIGHDVQQLVEFREIMKRAFFWGGSLTILLGLGFGLALSFRPLRRIEQIQQVCDDIVHGNFKQRLPLTKRHDELDMLAAIVNRMLDEIERLMSEVKSVGDHIAHDLRTPLTRLRAVLYRLQQQFGEAPAQRAMVEQAIGEVDSLLQRFRALLRISEIENKQRRAGFKQVRLQDILEQALGLFAPLAEDKSIRLSLRAEALEPIQGDGELLFEAISNLLDNAIKFTPPGGVVEISLTRGAAGPQIDIVDNGAGIGEAERAAVLNRFYRGSNVAEAPGHGLGLSIVIAIVRLHDFTFELGEANPGTRATIFCWPHGI